MNLLNTVLRIIHTRIPGKSDFDLDDVQSEHEETLFGITVLL